MHEPDYARDSEFQKLRVRQSDVNLARAALELARDADPDLDLAKPLDWIAQRTQELQPDIAAWDERQSLEALGECLSGRHGLIGSPEAFEDPNASYLHKVIETGRGIPISLSVISLAVAEPLDLLLAGVSAPMHFLTRLETGQGPLFFDAYSGGEVLTLSECLTWLSDLTELPENQLLSTLEPVGPRAIIVRMLNNLKVLHARREDWPAAWKVQHRLSTLQPASYNERRDLGIISLHAGRFSLAVDVLTACLAKCPAEEQDILQGHLKEAQRQLAEWN